MTTATNPPRYLTTREAAEALGPLPADLHALLVGVGVIYRATDTTLGREVVVKVLREEYGPESAAARRFSDEAPIAGQLQHPAIPPIHDLGALSDGRPFLAMKLIKGATLDHLLEARSDVSADRGRFVAVFEQVCQALAYAHSHNVIHRDLKPVSHRRGVQPRREADRDVRRGPHGAPVGRGLGAEDAHPEGPH